MTTCRPTSSRVRALGAFSHEKYFGRYNDADNNDDRECRRQLPAHHRVHRSRRRPRRPSRLRSVTLTNEPVPGHHVASRRTAAPVEEHGIQIGENGTANDFDGTYDHDNDPATGIAFDGRRLTASIRHLSGNSRGNGQRRRACRRSDESHLHLRLPVHGHRDHGRGAVHA